MSHSSAAALVIAHGSRNGEALAEFLRQVALLQEQLPGVRIASAVLEFPTSEAVSIQDSIDSLVEEHNVDRLVALPLFLFDAGHVAVDIPAEIRQAQARHAHLDIQLVHPLSAEDGLLDVIMDRAAELTAQLPIESDTAVLLVGAGTSSQESNAELFRVARLLWERRLAPLVEVAFVSLTRPTVVQGLARCQALGARRVLVLPYFLNTGVLARRIHEHAQQGARATGLQVEVGSHIGAHPALITAVAARLRRALAGDSEVSKSE